MASGARKSPSSATIDPARSGTHRAVGRVIEYQQYIDGQLRKTRARVKWVDFWTSLSCWASAWATYWLRVDDH
jgi:hypothetical protein